MNARHTPTTVRCGAALIAAAIGGLAMTDHAPACDRHVAPTTSDAAASQLVAVHPVFGSTMALNSVAFVPGAAAASVHAPHDDDDDQRVRARNRVFVAEIDDDGKHVSHEVKVEVKNSGETIVWINGKKVPDDRLRREHGRIIVLDENGEEIRSVRIWDDGEHGMWMDRGHFHFAREDQEPWALRLQGDVDFDANPPAVMLGVYMEPPGPALCKHLKLDQGASTLITGVYEGLAAYQAGLDVYDIIVAIDGNEEAGPSQLRDVLRERQPGGTISLTIIHESTRRSVEIELDAYDREKMRSAKLLGRATADFRTRGEFIVTPFGPGEREPVFVTPPDVDDLNLDAREIERIVQEAIRGAMRHAEDAHRLGADELHRRLESMEPDIDRYMEKLHRHMEHMERMLERMERRLHDEHDDDDDDADDRWS